jgi:predicted site-specific integrase-resolvase
VAGRLISHAEVAERCHVSESTSRRWGRRGLVEEVRLSEGVVRVREESVDQLTERGYGPPQGVVRRLEGRGEAPDLEEEGLRA